MALKRHLQFEAPPAPRQIRALAGLWALGEGNHPFLARALPELPVLPLFPTPEDEAALLGLGLPVALVTHGHHLVEDNGFEYAAGGKDSWPLAPVFVRDLCGRVVHTGLSPLAAPPAVPLFPTGCADVTATVPGADLIENALFLTVRRLECTPASDVQLAGQVEAVLQALYPHPTATPYKLRADTFYADGWRLPQVPRVFARNAPQVEAQAAGQNFMQRWHQRPAGQTYEEFYEAVGGASWFEELFLQGCTVIPTLEACNGVYQVDDEYHAVGVEAGRAVSGLHVVVEERDSDQPAKTILDVVEPGWVMQTLINPAKVIISNGKLYTAPEAPLPLLPNLHWPHPRQSREWGAVWLPTHPQHFAEPALWDWGPSGHFIQISGPLWDPLHYTYSSVLPMLRALRKPIEGNPYLYQLPPVLKERFHPVVAQNWYDVISEKTWQQREEDVSHPLHGSALDHMVFGTPVASLGYHPLPVGLEYELDPGIFPSQNPCHQTQPCPPELESRLVGRAALQVPLETCARYNVVLSEGMRKALQDAEAAEDKQMEATGPVWLPHIPSSHLLINVKRLFAQRAYRQALQNVAERYNIPTLPSSFYRFREDALSWRRLRYRLFTKYAQVWLKSWHKGLDLQAAETLVMQGELGESGVVHQARLGAPGIRLLPAQQALGLPSPMRKAKMHRRHK